MQAKSIAECSVEYSVVFLNYIKIPNGFHAFVLSICLFLSGRLKQVYCYLKIQHMVNEFQFISTCVKAEHFINPDFKNSK